MDHRCPYCLGTSHPAAESFSASKTLGVEGAKSKIGGTIALLDCLMLIVGGLLLMVVVGVLGMLQVPYALPIGLVVAILFVAGMVWLK